MLEVVTLRARPDLRSQVFSAAIQSAWPEFMRHDPIAELYFSDGHLDAYLDLAFAIVDSADPNIAVGRAFAVPFAFGETQDRARLPDTGWDGVILWAHHDRMNARPANAVSALEIMLLPSHRGQGASRLVLDAMRRQVRALGYRHMFAPVRPTSRHLEPTTPMADFVARVGADGLPADPWLRVHARAGGTIVGIAPRSMVIHGSLQDWRAWTGLPLLRSGPAIVPGALVPIQVSVEHDHAVYVEPNVWVRHIVV